MIRILAVFAIVCPLIVVAQPCAEWGDTMSPPEYLDIHGGDIMVHDGLALVAGSSSLEIRDAQTPDLAILGSCPMPFTTFKRFRLIDGQVYMACGSSGIWRVDAGNPAVPAMEVVFSPEADICDLAEFDGGVIAVTPSGEFYVLDNLDSGEILAEGTVSGTVTAVVAREAYAFTSGSHGITPVSLENPANPVIGDSEWCTPEFPLYNYEVWCRDIVIHGDHVYAAIYFVIWPDGTPWAMYLQKFDISSPLEPIADVCRPIDHEIRNLSVTPTHLVAQSQYSLAFYRPSDLEVDASVMIPGDGARYSSGIYSTSDEALVISQWDGLWLLDTSSMATVMPATDYSMDYNPGSGGRFGLGLRAFGDSASPRWVIQDQTDPIAPTIVHEFNLESGWNQSAWSSLASQNERWVILRQSYVYDDHIDNYYSWEDLIAVDIAGNVHELASYWDIVTHLCDDHLWAVSQTINSESTLEVFDLGGDEPLALGSFDLASPGVPIVADDRLLIIDSNSINVFDVTDPEAPTFLAEVEFGFSLYRSKFPKILSDHQLFVASNRGVVMLSLTTDPADPVQVRHHFEIGHAARTMALQGDMLAVGTSAGLTLISVSDIEHPTEISTTSGIRCDDLVWSGDHLYIGTEGSVYLFNVSDPAIPLWSGQAAFQRSTSKNLAMRSHWLLNGQDILPLDCSDIMAIEEQNPDDDEIILPSADILLTITPNPFNPRTTIHFNLSETSHVTMSVHDLRGHQISRLVDDQLLAGHHETAWHGQDDQGRAMPSGTYFIRLVTDTSERTTKAVLIR